MSDFDMEEEKQKVEEILKSTPSKELIKELKKATLDRMIKALQKIKDTEDSDEANLQLGIFILGEFSHFVTVRILALPLKKEDKTIRIKEFMKDIERMVFNHYKEFEPIEDLLQEYWETHPLDPENDSFFNVIQQKHPPKKNPFEDFGDDFPTGKDN